MKQRREPLEHIDRAALIEGYLLLEDRVRSLEKQVNDWRQLLTSRLAKTPANSSLPSGQSPKANKKSQAQAKRDPKPGHVGKSRERQEPDEVIECRVAWCKQCGEDLSLLPQHRVGRHQIIDLPPIRPVVREVVRDGRCCPHCGTYQRATPPAGFERGRGVGQPLEQVVLYLHYAHPLSYQRVQQILEDLCGIQLSEGALVNRVERAKERLQQGADVIHEQIQQAAVVGSDETGVRLAGVNGWQGVFQTPRLVYYVMRPSRSAQGLRDVMTDAQPEVWVSDVLSSQMGHPAHQYPICLAHQVRDVQYEIDAQHCSWATALQSLLYQAMHLGKRRSSLSQQAYEQQVADIEQQMDALLKTYPKHKGSQRLWRRYRQHRASVFLFLHRADVPPTNNASEQALRNSVIYRKVTGGFRTTWGAELYANLMSILETARRQGRATFDTLSMIFARQPTFSWIRE
jgi:transposase